MFREVNFVSGMVCLLGAVLVDTLPGWLRVALLAVCVANFWMVRLCS